MNAIVAGYPDQEIHVVLDNLKTHKPKRDRWLARHKNVHFHVTPTHTSWLNQVEIWFSILARSTLDGASFASVAQLRQAIDAFIQAYNANATPFQWRRATIHPKGLAPRITDLRQWVLAGCGNSSASAPMQSKESWLASGRGTMAACARGSRSRLAPMIVLGSRRSWRIATADRSMSNGRGSC